MTRNEASQIQLFEVDAVRGTERAIPVDSATRIYALSQVRSDSVMVAPMMVADFWFNPLGLVDLKSGRSTRLAGDGASDLVSAAWTPDGQIVALRQGLKRHDLDVHAGSSPVIRHRSIHGSRVVLRYIASGVSGTAPDDWGSPVNARRR